MRYSKDKDINRLIRQLIRLGWRFQKGRHGKLKPPNTDSIFVTVPSTPSDRRAFRNFLGDLRKLPLHGMRLEQS